MDVEVGSKSFVIEDVYNVTSHSKHRLGQPRYKLLQDYNVTNLNYEGWDFTIPAGFEWDGADTVLFSSRLLIPALVHDHIYSGQGDERVIQLTRKDADDLFLFYMKHSKIPKWVRYPVYWAVRAFGGGINLFGCQITKSHWQGRLGNNTYESPVMPVNKRYNSKCLTCNGTGWHGITKGFGGNGLKRCNICNRGNQ